MDYGYPTAPTMKNAPASPSKLGGKWRLTKNPSDSKSNPSSGSVDQPVVGIEEQQPASPQKQKKGFKISLPKKALEKRKEKKKEKDHEALSDLGSSHHTRGSDFDMAGVLLPPWENPTLMAEDSSTAAAKQNQSQTPNKSAIVPTKTRRKDDATLEKRGISNRSVLSSKSVSSKKTLSTQMSHESLGLDCYGSSSSSISLEDIGCITLDGSSEATQGFPITDKSSACGGSVRNSGRAPALQRTVSANSTASSRVPSLRRTCSISTTSASDSNTKLSQAPSQTTLSRKETTSSMNASMDLDDIFNDSDNKISIIENNENGSKHEKSQNNHNNRNNQVEELLEQENEMLRLAMERSVHDFSVNRSTSSGSTSRGTQQRLQQPAVRSRLPPKVPEPRKSSCNMNKSMDLQDLGNQAEKHGGDGVCGRRSSGEDDDLDEQERRMLEIALHRSVHDVGGFNSPVVRSGHAARHLGTRRNMSMDLTAVFEQDSESVNRRRVDDNLPRLKERGITQGGSDGGYSTQSQAGLNQGRGRREIQGPRRCEGGSEWRSHDDSGILAQQEEEMIRLAMERSMQDFAPPSSPLRQADLSPRRSSDQEAYRHSANVSLIQSRHTRNFPADHNSSYTYSHIKRHPTDPASPQRPYSSRDNDTGRLRDLRGGRRHRQLEPPIFSPQTNGELSNINEQEHAMLDEVAKSHQDFRQASRYT